MGAQGGNRTPDTGIFNPDQSAANDAETAPIENDVSGDWISKPPPLEPGAEVEVTEGLAAGLRGRRCELAKVRIEGEETWSVEFAFGLRVMRAKYLRRVEVRP